MSLGRCRNCVKIPEKSLPSQCLTCIFSRVIWDRLLEGGCAGFNNGYQDVQANTQLRIF